MERKRNEKIVPFAKHLRNNMTKEERHLWYDFLRDYPIKFTRQKVLGQYIADFYCAERKLVIELDGSQHYEESGLQSDEERTQYLEEFDIKVVRIPNNLVNQEFESVCEYIDNVVNGVAEG